MQRTTNYNLCQWAAEDRIMRSDFNADNQKIDAALATMPRIVTGTYVGDGTASRFIDLGFTPRALYVCAESGAAFDQYTSNDDYLRYIRGGLALPGHPLRDRTFSDSETIALSIVNGGFQTVCTSRVVGNPKIMLYTNEKNVTYHYIALV